MPCVPQLFFDDGLIQSTHHVVSFILNTTDVLGSLSPAPATDRNDFLNLMARGLFLTRPTREHGSSETYPYVFINCFLNLNCLQCCQCSGL